MDITSAIEQCKQEIDAASTVSKIYQFVPDIVREKLIEDNTGICYDVTYYGKRAFQVLSNVAEWAFQTTMDVWHLFVSITPS